MYSASGHLRTPINCGNYPVWKQEIRSSSCVSVSMSGIGQDMSGCSDVVKLHVHVKNVVKNMSTCTCACMSYHTFRTCMYSTTECTEHVPCSNCLLVKSLCRQWNQILIQQRHTQTHWSDIMIICKIISRECTCSNYMHVHVVTLWVSPGGFQLHYLCYHLV